jgi:hypothetical protein
VVTKIHGWRKPEDGDSVFLRNTGIDLNYSMAGKPGRPHKLENRRRGSLQKYIRVNSILGLILKWCFGVILPYENGLHCQSGGGNYYFHLQSRSANREGK